jgi:hypothetical protein
MERADYDFDLGRRQALFPKNGIGGQADNRMRLTRFTNSDFSRTRMIRRPHESGKLTHTEEGQHSSTCRLRGRNRNRRRAAPQWLT